ncbi:MAG: ABC transporter permease [Deltaproteobacteria bacterium]|nr:ABC transporter permease [Deltaproteobacteria bacterium]
MNWLVFRLLRARGRFPLLRRLAMGGIVVGVASLIITFAILDGFGTAYRDGLINFNAPVMILREDEQLDKAAVTEAVRAVQALPQAGERGVGTAIRSATRVLEWWDYLEWQYDRLLMAVEPWPRLHAGFVAASPFHYVRERQPPVWLERCKHFWFGSVEVEARHGVIAASPFLYREGLLVGGGTIRGVALRGVQAEAAMQVMRVELSLDASVTSLRAALTPRDAEDLPIVLGQALAEQVGAGEVQLFLPRDPKARRAEWEGRTVPVRVVGTFSSGIYEFDTQFALLDLALMQRLYQRPNVVTGVELQLDDLNKAPWITSALTDRLGPDYHVVDWRELHRETFEALAMEKILFGLVMAILIAVAAGNITTTIIIHILDQVRTVATLCTLGMTRRRAQRLFFWQGMGLGGCGVLLGLGLGAFGAWSLAHWRWFRLSPEVYFIPHVPAELHWVTVGAVALLGLGLCALAAHFAARRVTRLPLLHALGRGFV